jgi:glucose-1-phosphate cytidylyltransferase
MKVVILAGGLGTRLAEETGIRPKPMVDIGGKPVLWHIMKIYSQHGLNDFVVCLGYKGYLIKEYFANYFLHQSDVTFDLRTNRMQVHQNTSEPWTVTLIDTGDATMTGGRLNRVRQHVQDDTFCFTYGDGVSDVDITALLGFHRRHETAATVTVVQPPGRFGAVDIRNEKIDSFQEKPRGDGGWVNGGFFVLEPSVFDYLGGDDTVWEREPLERLAAEGQLAAYRHDLEDLWSSGKAPCKIW